MVTMLQQDRPLQLATVLGPDRLLLRGFTGTEAISRPYSFVLDLLSDDPGIDGAELLRTPITLTMSLPDGKERRIHAWVNRFLQLGQHEEQVFYQAEMVPRLWFAGLVHDCRIFQNKTVPQILDEVLKQHAVDFKLQLTGSYPPREYCVQYRESDLDFASRLMEEEGIFYWFDHASDDGEVLMVADANSATPPCPDQETAQLTLQEQLYRDVVLSIFREQAVHTSKITLKSYDYLRPPLSLNPSVDSTVSGFGEEFYDFTGEYTTDDEGYRRARLRVEAEEAQQQVVRGTSNCRAFLSGTRFTLDGHFNPALNQEYLLTEVRHEARGGGYRTGQNAPFSYMNGFTAIPSSLPYRPPRLRPKPVIYGTQTAVVVGPSGEEVYTDAHARVKVQFHWDRLGKHDENSSCWIRYAQPWAGKGWGSASIPRIGNEVVLSFLDGDPDQPLITGSVYNAEQVPPFGLPGANIQMGMKSRSSPGGGGYNEISMTDTKGKEGLNIHAQYDMTTTVEHDRTTTVKNDDALTVSGGNRTIKVETGTHDETIKGNTTVTITTGDHKLDVQTGTHTHHVKGVVTETYDADQNTTVKKSITIDGGDIITLKSGQSSIKLKKDGTIEIHGKNISIIGDSTVKVSGDKVEATAGTEAKLGVGNQQVTCDKAKVNVSGAAINASAVGMHEITGAVVKIN